MRDSEDQISLSELQLCRHWMCTRTQMGLGQPAQPESTTIGDTGYCPLICLSLIHEHLGTGIYDPALSCLITPTSAGLVSSSTLWAESQQCALTDQRVNHILWSTKRSMASRLREVTLYSALMTPHLVVLCTDKTPLL